jgi:ribosomal protein S18 acetylase RimI-like enzyme
MPPAVTIRATVLADIPILSEFWYDQMAWLQHTNPRIRLAPDARHQWEMAMSRLLSQPNAIMLTSVLDDDVVGAILATILPNTPGLLPERIAQVTTLIVDIHTPHRQHGTGRYLLAALKNSLAEQHIAQLQVVVAATAVVEQAFWRGLGAKNNDDIFWMAL